MEGWSPSQGRWRQAYSLCRSGDSLAGRTMSHAVGDFPAPRQALAHADGQRHRGHGGSAPVLMPGGREEQRSEGQLCHTCQASGFGTFGDLIAPPSFGVDLYKVVPLRCFVGSICADRGISADRRMDRAIRYARSHGTTLGSGGLMRKRSVSRMGKTDD